MAQKKEHFNFIKVLSLILLLTIINSVENMVRLIKYNLSLIGNIQYNWNQKNRLP